MQKKDGQLLYSPTDLIRFMESPYSSWMERLNLERPGKLTPDQDSDEMKLVAATGDRHEKNFLARLKRDGTVHEITRSASAVNETKEAIQSGSATIFQACLQKDRFKGYADFLHRYGTSSSGQALYEVWDTKLARKSKPYYLVQLCCYAEMLADLQGVLPPKVRVVLGSGDMPEYRTADFYHYYLELKAAFLDLMDQFDAEIPPEPDPAADHGRWSSHAQHWLEEKDHLVQVANINQSQIKKLNLAGIHTVAELATVTKKIPNLSAEIQERLTEQALLQVSTRKQSAEAGHLVAPLFRVLPPASAEPNRGLGSLPPESRMDVFFDMEGFPLAERGLEYLFGASTRKSDGSLDFHDWWAHNEAQEKTAFEGFIDWAYARWESDPYMHIYHYASYEVTRMRSLMGKHGTREDKVDNLLRHGVFVDLYQTVKQGLRVGTSSYSIKAIELLYRGKRSGEVSSAGQSIVYYANWLESGEPQEWQRSFILKKIRDYNEDDCVSTVQLYDWLLARQREADISFFRAPQKKASGEEPDPEVQAQKEEHARLITALEKKVNAATKDELKRLHTLFLHLLEFHRREKKPSWWRLFSRLSAEPEELKEDIDCIGDATLLPAETQQKGRSKIFTYRFDPNQDTKVSKETKLLATVCTDAVFTVEAIDDKSGRMQLKISDKEIDKKFTEGLPVQTSFIPSEQINDKGLQDAVTEIIRSWVDQEKIPACLENFLLRQRPRITGEKTASGPLQKEGEDMLKTAIRCALGLDGAALVIQGPPGCGKTTTAAAMIRALVQAGKTVGITSNSHKAIENLLLSCLKGAERLHAIKVGGSKEFAQKNAGITFVEKTADGETFFSEGVIGGTAWLFSRPEWTGKLDYLFVDEAGQVSLANLVAMSRATKNLIILGDQMQLEQPTQGQHPGESGQSILSYYLQQHATIPHSLGLFLPLTHRLQPDICRFVSEMIYEGRLQPAKGNEKRRVLKKAYGEQLRLPEAGLLFAPVEHEGNVQASDEEAAMITRIVNDLQGRNKCDANGVLAGKVDQSDILIVAPYNMQVRKLRDALPHYVDRIASVDKFQGQEADIVIVSMCSSFGEYGSRGLEFILDENRLNVAISRARTLAIVVGDPRIARAPASNIPSMHRLNLYCRLTQGPKLREEKI